VQVWRLAECTQEFVMCRLHERAVDSDATVLSKINVFCRPSEDRLSTVVEDVGKALFLRIRMSK